ncbi:MAG: exopolysaccharide biosynthesis protein [Acidobacteria bacterium]|nr:exopolysaccharide biosynthesis protein [Acidobacteriota bacterium]
MIDIHCHLLPGVDDGPPDEATAIAMCRLAAQNGTTDLVATPHANSRFPYSPEQNEQKRLALEAAVGPEPRIHRGCDFRLSYDNIEAALADPSRFTINGGRYLLVEFAEAVISHGSSEIFARLGQVGLTPIITHPERNAMLRGNRSRLAVWIQRGCLIQVTGQSLLGHFGSHARDAAITMMNAGLVHVIASDGHDLEKRPPVLADCFAYVSDRWGDEVAGQLFLEVPRAVLESRVIKPPAPRIRHRRKWWAFWRS